MAKIGLPKGSGKWLKVREKSVKSQGILKWILSGNPENGDHYNLPPPSQILRIIQYKTLWMALFVIYINSYYL